MTELKDLCRMTALGALLALGACASDPQWAKPCPVTGVLGDAERMTVFGPSGVQEPSNIAYTVTISGVSLKCGANEERVRSKVALDISFEPGPASAGARVTVPYFIAVTRGKNFILARESYAHRFTGTRTETSREHVKNIRIPLAEGTTGASYQVVVGLVLTPEQVAYNRTQLQQ